VNYIANLISLEKNKNQPGEAKLPIFFRRMDLNGKIKQKKKKKKKKKKNKNKKIIMFNLQFKVGLLINFKCYYLFYHIYKNIFNMTINNYNNKSY